MRYTFIRANSTIWPVRWLCRLLEVHPSGFYAWRRQPKSARTKANEYLTGLIKQFWLESGGVYGYRKIHCDLRDVGEQCSKNRVYRLMRAAGLRAQVGYRRPRQRNGPASVLAPNRLQQKFEVANPNEA
jgi:putative transposase